MLPCCHQPPAGRPRSWRSTRRPDSRRNHRRTRQRCSRGRFIAGHWMGPTDAASEPVSRSWPAGDSRRGPKRGRRPGTARTTAGVRALATRMQARTPVVWLLPPERASQADYRHEPYRCPTLRIRPPAGSHNHPPDPRVAHADGNHPGQSGQRLKAPSRASSQSTRPIPRTRDATRQFDGLHSPDIGTTASEDPPNDTN